MYNNINFNACTLLYCVSILKCGYLILMYEFDDHCTNYINIIDHMCINNQWLEYLQTIFAVFGTKLKI